jgi:hypothetical protein
MSFCAHSVLLVYYVGLKLICISPNGRDYSFVQVWAQPYLTFHASHSYRCELILEYIYHPNIVLP